MTPIQEVLIVDIFNVRQKVEDQRQVLESAFNGKHIIWKINNKQIVWDFTSVVREEEVNPLSCPEQLSVLQLQLEKRHF